MRLLGRRNHMTEHTQELLAGELGLIDQFAGFLKYSAIYPANNVRVKKSCVGFFVAFERVKAVHGSRIVIALERGRFLVAGVPIDRETPVITWARQAFVKTALGGIEVDANVQRWSLARFANQLRDNCTYPDGTFSSFWSKSFPGIVPFELRYSGDYDNRVRNDRVIRNLLHSDSLKHRLDNLRALLSENLPAGEAAQINLLEPIRKALPVEAVLDPKTAEDLVERILAVCESKVLAMVAQKDFTDHDLVEIALAGIGRRYFKAHVKDMAVQPQDSLPEGRPEDAATTDDLDQMLAEYAALPAVGPIDLRIHGPEYVRETLGVFLHSLVVAVSDDPPAALLVRRLLDAHPEHSDLLRPYVDRCLGEAGLHDENRGCWRVIELLQQADPLGILKGREYLTPAAVVFTFPRQLVPFIDSKPSHDARGLADLARICHEVGQDRIQEAADYLLGPAGLVTRMRLKKVLSVDSDDLLPLAGVLARVSEEWVRASVARFIRRRNPPVQESAALRVVRPLSLLSPHYLQGLCVLEPGAEHRQWLRDESSRLLRVFLRKTAGMSDQRERRIRAVHMLGALPSRENIELLGEVIEETGFGLLRWGAWGLHRAARKARREMIKQAVKRET